MCVYMADFENVQKWHTFNIHVRSTDSCSKRLLYLDLLSAHIRQREMPTSILLTHFSADISQKAFQVYKMIPFACFA